MIKDWIGYIVNGGKHRLQITNEWKNETPKMYWWKCADCSKSSGVISESDLIRLYSYGLVDEPNGSEIAKNSSHPKEQTHSNQGYAYEFGGWD